MKALFLDRDGIINVDHGYVSRSEDFEFTNGIFALCRAFTERGFLIVVVTNQSGIGRGYYTEKEFHTLSDWMVHQFAKHGIDIAGVYFCPHHPDKAQGKYRQQCDCRKPEPGMLLTAAEALDIELSRSVMIGDKPSDMVAAAKAGVTKGVLVGAPKSEVIIKPLTLITASTVADVMALIPTLVDDE